MDFSIGSTQIAIDIIQVDLPSQRSRTILEALQSCPYGKGKLAPCAGPSHQRWACLRGRCEHIVPSPHLPISSRISLNIPMMFRFGRKSRPHRSPFEPPRESRWTTIYGTNSEIGNTRQ